MAKRSSTRTEKQSPPLIVLVGRHPRCPKVRELTQGWDDAEWKFLCEKLIRDRFLKSCLPEEGLVIMPDFEALDDLVPKVIHRTVKDIFTQRQRHSEGCILTILSCFQENGAVDVALRRAFETFLSVNGDCGRAILLFTHEL